MVLAWVLLLSLFREYFTQNCLVTDPENLSRCLYCKNGYYSKESSSSGESPNFDPSDCRLQEDAGMPSVDVFVSSFGCTEALECSGEPEKPFRNLWEAFKMAERLAERSRSIKVRIYLLKSSGSTGAQEFFLDRAGANSGRNFFFRRITAEVWIRPLSCSERQIPGCFLESDAKPTVYIRTEKSFLFIANTLSVEDLLFDGSEILLDNFEEGPEETSAKRCQIKYCDSSDFKKNIHQDPSKRNQICARFGRELKTEAVSAYALFNLEPLIDLPGVEVPKSSLRLKNCGFRYFGSSDHESKPSTLIALISITKLPYEITIVNTNFSSVALPKGILTSFDDEVPLVYQSLEAEYEGFSKESRRLGDDLFSLSMMKCLVESYNEFESKFYIGSRPGVISISGANHNLTVVDCSFVQNYFREQSQSVIFFLKIPSGEETFSSQVYFYNNQIFRNSITSFLLFEGNSNTKLPKNIISVVKSSFSRNTNGNIVCSYANLILAESEFRFVEMSAPMILIEVGHLSVSDSAFAEIRNAEGAYDFSLFQFKGLFSDAPLEILTGEIRNLSSESFSAKNSLFHAILIDLIHTPHTLNSLFLGNNSFMSCGSSELSMVFDGSVEDAFIVTGNKFSSFLGNCIFKIQYSRGVNYDSNIFEFIAVDYIHSSLVTTINVEIVIRISRFVLINSSLRKSAFSVFYNYLNSYISFQLFELIFKNIAGGGSCLFDLSTSGNVNFTKSSFEKLGNMVCLCSVDDSSPFFESKLIMLSDLLFLQTAEREGVAFASLQKYDYLMLNNSKIIFSGNTNNNVKQGSIIELKSTVQRKTQIYYSIFFGNIAQNGGAIYIRAGTVQTIIIRDCLFAENRARLFGADIILETVETFKDFLLMANKINSLSEEFGLIRNQFLAASGPHGASIYVFPSGQLYLIMNKFANISGGIGGAIFLREHCHLICSRNLFANVSGKEDGGVIAVLSSIVYFLDSVFENIQAQNGGAFYIENAEARVSHCEFRKVSSAFALIASALDSTLFFRHSEISHSHSDYRGSFVSSRSSIFIESVKIVKSVSNGSSVFLHSDKSKIVFISHVTILETVSRVGAAIYIYGRGLEAYVIEDLVFNSNMLAGDFFYGVDSTIHLKKCSILNAVSKTALLVFDSVQRESSVRIQGLDINFSQIDGTIFQAKKGAFTISNASIRNITSRGTSLRIFSVKTCVLSLENFRFKADFLNIQGFIFYIESSDVKLTSFYIELPLGFSGVYLDSCRSVFLDRFYLGSGGILNVAAAEETPAIACKSGLLQINQSLFTNLASPVLFGELCSVVLENVKITKSVKVSKGSAAVLLKGDVGLNLSITNSIFLDNGESDLSASLFSSFYVSKTGFSQLPGNRADEAITCSDNLNILLESLSFWGYEGLTTISVTAGTQTRFTLVAKNLKLQNIRSSSSGGGLRIAGNFDVIVTDSIFKNVSTEQSGGVFYLSCKSARCGLSLANISYASASAMKYGDFIYSENENVLISEKNNTMSTADSSSAFSTSPSRIVFVDYPDAGIFHRPPNYFDRSWKLVTEFSNRVSGRQMSLLGLLFDSNGNFKSFEEKGQAKFISESANSTFINELSSVEKGFFIFNHLVLNAPPGSILRATLAFSSSEVSFNQSITFKMRECIRGEIISGTTCQECPAGLFSLVDDPKAIGLRTCFKCPATAECPGKDTIIPAKGFWRKDANQSIIIKCLKEQACPGGGSFSPGVFSPVCSKGFAGPLCFICEEGFGYDAENLCVNCSSSPYHYTKFAVLVFISIVWIVYQTLKAFKIDEESSKTRAMIKIMVDHMSYATFIFSLKIEWISLVSGVMSFADQYVSTVPKDIFNFDCFLSFMFESGGRYLANAILVSITPIIYFIASLSLLIIFINLRCRRRRKKANAPEIIDSATKREMCIELGKSERKVYELSPSSNDAVESQEQRNILFTAREDLDRLRVVETSRDAEAKNTLRRPSIGTDFMVMETAGYFKEEGPAARGHRKFKNIASLTAMLIIIFYNFYPRLMMNAVKFFRCVEIDDSGVTFVEFLPKTQCWTGEHIKMVALISVLNIFIWGLATPFLLFLITKQIIKVQKQTSNRNLTRLLNFITMDYKDAFFFWDLHSYYTKFMVVLLSVVCYTLDASSQGAILIFFFLLLMHIQEKFKPYRFDFANNLKTVSYASSVMAAIFAIMGSSEELDTSQKFITLTCAVALLYIFYFVWGYYFVRMLIQARRKAQAKRPQVQMQDKKFDKICRYISGLIFRKRKKRENAI